MTALLRLILAALAASLLSSCYYDDHYAGDYGYRSSPVYRPSYNQRRSYGPTYYAPAYNRYYYDWYRIDRDRYRRLSSSERARYERLVRNRMRREGIRQRDHDDRRPRRTNASARRIEPERRSTTSSDRKSNQRSSNTRSNSRPVNPRAKRGS